MWPAPRHRSRTSGFTLIEMMIVMVIAASLAAAAYPSYVQHARRARLAEATGALQDVRAAAERFFQDARTYVGMPCAVSGRLEHFNLSCAVRDGGYTVLATGKATMAGFAYSIDQTNARRTVALPPGWAGASAASTCWVVRQDGAC